MAVTFFRDLIGGFSTVPSEDYFVGLNPTVNDDDNASLTSITDEIEIKNTVFSLSKNSAPGPDGFNGVFDQVCWNIIGADVIDAVQFFFKGGSFPRSVSATVLTLIPKVKNAIGLDQLRPISLCNFLHKIISKILNDRIRPMLDKVISLEQFGFIPGRSIHQCIALSHDLASDLNNKVHGGNVMIKMDMAKAYDRLSWIFLMRGMKAFGFSEKWCDLIYRNISNCWYSIRIRGKTFRHFKSNRGVRQGDPLSPSLFIIAMEVLSRKLKAAGSPGGGMMPYWSSIRALEINHLFYADDIIIFTNGGKASFIKFLRIMDSFCGNSGQQLNAQKCKIFFSKHIKGARRNSILAMSGYSQGSFPVKYLGAPLFPGQPRINYFRGLVDQIRSRVEGWMQAFLSIGGRLTLIQSVLSSIPIHCLSVLPVPKGVLRCIEQILCNFLWKKGKDYRHHWVRWGVVCKPKKAGGLGIKSLQQVMVSLHGKLAWNYLVGSSLWAAHARSRYIIGGRGSHLWKNLSPLISRVSTQCRWILGDGETKVTNFCTGLGDVSGILLLEKCSHPLICVVLSSIT